MLGNLTYIAGMYVCVWSICVCSKSYMVPTYWRYLKCRKEMRRDTPGKLWLAVLCTLLPTMYLRTYLSTQ
ncbi:hypothetical protein F5X96DRAFT_663374 [Biscogniauxia mediterranea]|nr:hypothetical protein F5X96DRAFT_663374 [Biscogniauxia mediterranea]